MKNKNNLIYWISTSLFSLMMLMSAGMYIFNNEVITKVFEGLGFPSFIIYPLAIAKILGLISILTRKVDLLKYLAYAGFFFNALLAFGAHIAVADGEAGGAVMAMILLITSFFFERKLSTNPQNI